MIAAHAKQPAAQHDTDPVPPEEPVTTTNAYRHARSESPAKARADRALNGTDDNRVSSRFGGDVAA